VRRLVFALIGLGLVAIVVIGLTQSEGGVAPNPNEIESRAPSEAEVRQAFADAPPALDRLHERANEIIPGGRREYERQLDALRGHPVVVNFWGSWCGPCRLEFPVFQQQAVEFGDRVAFLGVNARDNREEAEEFLAEFPVTFPSVEDGSGGIASRLGARGYPTTAFYDERGERVSVHQGIYERDEDLAAAIRRHLDVE
jgi:cytochrome c biogenesis protein CcmG, thiol:disulfide interchange protein DsbE